jgi:hypothetical protein
VPSPEPWDDMSIITCILSGLINLGRLEPMRALKFSIADDHCQDDLTSLENI